MSTEVLRYTAFSTDKAGGNPAGVVLDASQLDEPGMQRIAADVGYSETAFLSPTDKAGTHRVRYFSPLAEVDFCGHATIATAVALTERVGPGTLLLRTNIGDVPVRTAITDNGPTATLTSVTPHSRPATASEITDTLAALRWQQTEIDQRFPARVAFAGNDHLMLAAASRARLATLDYDFDALASVMRDTGWTTVHLFWADASVEGMPVFHARDPFPPGGVVEDAATGAAAAAFGGYLHDIGYRKTGRVIIRQGVDMGRPSVLTVDLTDTAGIQVTGNAVQIG
jgi:PhzF family phenazine biosynthesis protein